MFLVPGLSDHCCQMVATIAQQEPGTTGDPGRTALPFFMYPQNFSMCLPVG
jgi:hypothetical protein